MQPTDELGIISAKLFDEYTTAWDGFIASADAAELTALFTGPNDTSLPFVSLPPPQLLWLLSTLDMRQIKARFMLLPSASATQARFSVALYATGQDDTPASAYYLADATWQPAQPPLEDGEVPLALANAWLDNWAATSLVEPAMFATSTTPARGYNFTVRDFIDPLLASKTGGSGQGLRVYFGLHHYYAATEAEQVPAFKQAFGLVLRLDGADLRAAPAYDMAQLVPPGK
ncbi:MAG: hypothetical protein EOO63_00300 [Hymenobacter sp.]|nr:MAG: hypothetical protein EOO63_00300 [Hymenobacter sp.]